MQDGASHSDLPLPSPSPDIKTDKKICEPSGCDSSDVKHNNVTGSLHDDQSQGLPVLQLSSPRLLPVTTAPAGILPIRPFPLLEFIESHELTLLLENLESSDEGTSFTCHFILHRLKILLVPYDTV